MVYNQIRGDKNHFFSDICESGEGQDHWRDFDHQIMWYGNITIKKIVTKIDTPTEKIWVELGRQVLRLAKRLDRIEKERHCRSVTVMLDD